MIWEILFLCVLCWNEEAGRKEKLYLNKRPITGCFHLGIFVLNLKNILEMLETVFPNSDNHNTVNLWVCHSLSSVP